jgi:PAS domain S-box-containing protein
MPADRDAARPAARLELRPRAAGVRLRESEARRAAVLAATPDAIVIFDGGGRILEVNARAERIFGRAGAELAGRLVHEELVPALDRERAEELAAGGAALGHPMEMAGRRTDGGEFPLEARVVRVEIDGPPIFTASLRDLTEWRLAETAIGESEARAQALLDGMLGGVIMADDGYVIRSANAAAARMFGYPRGGLLGQHLCTILPEFGEEEGDLQLGEVEPQLVGGVSEWLGRRKDGSVFPFELSLCHIQYSGQRYVAGNLRDLSALQEIERMKQELVSTVNHELRTPLTSIRGALTLLAAGALGELPDEAAEVVRLAERNCMRLLALVNDILDLERLDRGQLEMSREPVAIAALFERSAEVVRGLADELGITIDLHPVPGALLGDPDRLVQVLVNLLSNAIKFSPPASSINLSAVVVQGTVEVRVRDRGRGIAAVHRDLIFERFKQVESSDARQKGGSGLGLAICRSIIEQLGGHIGVESGSESGVNVGSVFWFRLPAAAAESEGEAA